MTILSKLTLSDKTKAVMLTSPEIKLRGKMLGALGLQIEAAKARLNGETFIRRAMRWADDPETGERVRKEVPVHPTAIRSRANAGRLAFNRGAPRRGRGRITRRLPTFTRTMAQGQRRGDPRCLRSLRRQACAIKVDCTTGKERRITRWEHEPVLEAVQRRLDEHPEKMRQRRETVEHPFGTIKYWMGSTHFQMRTLKRVGTEMALHVLAYNLKRVMNIMGIVPLIEAMSAA